MDNLKRYSQTLFAITAVTLIGTMALCLTAWALLSKFFVDDQFLKIAAWVPIGTAIVIGAVNIIVRTAVKPLSVISDTIVHAGHSSRGGVAPNTNSIRVGRQLISSLAMQVYDLASISEQSTVIASEGGTSTAQNTTLPVVSSNEVLDHVNLPLIGVDADQKITVMNRSACSYFSVTAEQSIGQKFFDVCKLAFQTDETFESWLDKQQETTLTATRQWERVRITDENGKALKQFDLAVSYSKGNQTGTETMLALYDRTETYAHDDQETGFVAMAVHELRTPLTVMKGYIEVFEDEAAPLLSPELNGFVQKLRASAEQLTAFIGNILNVARIEENQLVLTLKENDWPQILQTAVADLELRANVAGKHINLQIAPDIPKVAVDRISIHEVINNLVDNAIKYSGNTDRIDIFTSVNQDGMIETSVQDHGIGIPTAVMPDLFQKFYRSHKSSVQIGGTGLGLYLCKALITAHGGNIWVRSKENEGSIFTFTIQAFDQVKHEQADSKDGIMRGAHGWIKNHSLNRQ